MYRRKLLYISDCWAFKLDKICTRKPPKYPLFRDEEYSDGKFSKHLVTFLTHQKAFPPAKYRVTLKLRYSSAFYRKTKNPFKLIICINKGV